MDHEYYIRSLYLLRHEARERELTWKLKRAIANSIAYFPEVNGKAAIKSLLSLLEHEFPETYHLIRMTRRYVYSRQEAAPTLRIEYRKGCQAPILFADNWKSLDFLANAWCLISGLPEVEIISDNGSMRVSVEWEDSDDCPVIHHYPIAK